MPRRRPRRAADCRRRYDLTLTDRAPWLSTVSHAQKGASSDDAARHAIRGRYHAQALLQQPIEPARRLPGYATSAQARRACRARNAASVNTNAARIYGPNKSSLGRLFSGDDLLGRPDVLVHAEQVVGIVTVLDFG